MKLFSVMLLTFMLVPVSASAQTMMVNLGITPDTSATKPMGYTLALDGGAPVDVGLPATNPACKDFTGGVVSACVPFSVTVTVGSHTVALVGYNLGGNSPAASITFQVTASPGNPANLRVVK